MRVRGRIEKVEESSGDDKDTGRDAGKAKDGRKGSKSRARNNGESDNAPSFPCLPQHQQQPLTCTSGGPLQGLPNLALTASTCREAGITS